MVEAEGLLAGGGVGLVVVDSARNLTRQGFEFPPRRRFRVNEPANASAKAGMRVTV